MTRIVIMDDNRSAGILLKKALEHDDHQVDLVASWNELGRKTVHPPIDLVLIHQAHQQNSGWRAFNQFKCINHNIPAMLYVLPDFRRASMTWIVKAVQEALTLMKKSDNTASRWTWDSGFNDIRLDHF
jgi:DNA-binding NtrC family response regulator